MTQDDVSQKLTRMRFVGKYSFSRLALESGLSRHVVREATAGRMSQKSQTRFEMMFRQLPEMCHVEQPKRKPGHKKRFLIRYLNLRNWIAIIEEAVGRNEKFKLKRVYDLSTNEKAGYVCTKLDHMLKWYLLRTFGPELQKKKVFMGDCYAAENWVDRIQKMLPSSRKDLMARLQHRKGLQK
jgi:hypothetical protein